MYRFVILVGMPYSRMFRATAILLCLSATSIADQPFDVVISSPYSEMLHGEGVYIRLAVTNVSTNPESIIRFDRLRNYGGMYGAIYAEVFDPMGNRAQDGSGTLGTHRTASGVQAEDLTALAPGAKRDEFIGNLSIRLTTPGKHKARVTYRPQLADGPEMIRELNLSFVALDDVLLEKKVVPNGVEIRGYVSEIMKVRTADGHWLFARFNFQPQPGLPKGLARLVQVSENTEFEVSAPEGSPRTTGGALGGSIRVTMRTDGNSQVLIVGYDSGAILRYEVSQQ